MQIFRKANDNLKPLYKLIGDVSSCKLITRIGESHLQSCDMPRCSSVTRCSRHQSNDNPCDRTCRYRRICKLKTTHDSTMCIIHKTENPDDAITCAICLDAIIGRADLCSLNCNGTSQVKHQFHQTCLSAWLAKDKDTCPTCRASVPPVLIRLLDPDRSKRLLQKPCEVHLPNFGMMLRVPRFINPDTNEPYSNHEIIAELAFAALQSLY